jgi:dinuclear metal center YbgI/SA1388 family protein
MGLILKLLELIDYTGQLLQVDRYRDYCPNGLQIEGAPEVSSVVSGVTASMALLERAAELGAQVVLVHHGYFWKGEDSRIAGYRRARIKFLLERDISLMAYHLPLDAHPELGNNAQLGGILGLSVDGWTGEQNLIAHGKAGEKTTLETFSLKLAKALGRQPLVVGEPSRTVSRVAWCTGAAQDGLEKAVELGVDLFITGEVSERTVHVARETGVAFIAAGHHATERYGVKALGEHLSARFGLDHHFIDVDNPV